jgi:hypothetical protein
VASGEWRVASGEWRAASGEWRVASGEWREARNVTRDGCFLVVEHGVVTEGRRGSRGGPKERLKLVYSLQAIRVGSDRLKPGHQRDDFRGCASRPTANF